MSRPLGDEDGSPRLLRPEWAGFAMEETFWINLELICAKQELALETYITRAQEYIGAAGRRFPNMEIGQAVRLRIVQDLRDQVMYLLGESCAASANHPMHAAIPVRPVTSAANPDIMG
jgi:predicted DNA-binding ribbon-helix-helix protein